jgi:SNF2 family DNA or RNA helicase
MINIIPQTAVDAFLKRNRRNLSLYKHFSMETCDRLMSELAIKPPIFHRLRRHQKQGFLCAQQLQRVALWFDTGTGKTLLAIALARYFRKASIARQHLVLVPSRVNKSEWEREIRKHSPHTSYTVLEGSSANKWKQLESTTATLVIETYAGLARMVCEPVTNKKKPGHKKLKPDKRAVRALCAKFEGLMMDEAHQCKSHDKLPFRICRQLSKTCNVVIPFTGTPFGRDPEDLWAQLFLVDRGETLGETLGLFRAAFFDATDNPHGGQDFTFDESKKLLLHKLLQNSSLRYEVKDADLPHLTRVPIHIPLSSEAQDYYERARQALRSARGNFRETKNAFLRMRQISSGFVGYHNDETGEKASYVFRDNPKLEATLEKVASVNAKSIIYHEFIYSGKLISDKLNEMRIKHVVISGSNKKTREPLQQFDEDDECRVLILSNMMAIGLNLQIAQYGHVYESPVSLITRKQAERRFHRQESRHDRVFLYDYIVDDTVDELILSYHQQGRDLFRAIVNGDVIP